MLRKLVETAAKSSFITKFSGPTVLSRRNYAALPKRFYRNTNIIQSNKKFEITLDQRKLKTPSGATFYVESEPLAVAVATEWDAQKDVVDRSSMHLTSLCNTVIDNPNHLTKTDLVNHIVNYLATDTILFYSIEERELFEEQRREWGPVIDWFNMLFESNLKASESLSPPGVDDKLRMRLARFLNSYDMPSLHAFVYAVDTMKSFILPLGCVRRVMTIEHAVQLSRLELEYQLKHWGRVEWAHDVDQQELQARLAAAVFFIWCHSTGSILVKKLP